MVRVERGDEPGDDRALRTERLCHRPRQERRAGAAEHQRRDRFALRDLDRDERRDRRGGERAVEEVARRLTRRRRDERHAREARPRASGPGAGSRVPGGHTATIS